MSTPTNPDLPLSDRQKEVLVLIAEGLTNTAVARKLHITEDVAKKITQRVFVKLGVNNRPAAVNQGWLRGLLHAGRTA